MRAVLRVLLPFVLAVPIVGVSRVDAGAAGDEDDTAEAPDDDGTDGADDEDGEDAADDDFSVPLQQQRAAPRPHRVPRGGCPRDMVRTGDGTCMDCFEAPNKQGRRPLVMQSATDAEDWCEAHHKRLCAEDEWIAACEGEEKRQYPYGMEHEDGRCNDDKVWRSVNELTLAKWPADEAKDHTKELYQAAPSGAKRGCKTKRGVYDLTGNVEEWVTKSRAHANAYAHILIGCYWSGCYGGGKPTCRSTNAAHGPEFRFYETGFRCCKDPAAPVRHR